MRAICTLSLVCALGLTPAQAGPVASLSASAPGKPQGSADQGAWTFRVLGTRVVDEVRFLTQARFGMGVQQLRPPERHCLVLANVEINAPNDMAVLRIERVAVLDSQRTACPLVAAGMWSSDGGIFNKVEENGQVLDKAGNLQWELADAVFPDDKGEPSKQRERCLRLSKLSTTVWLAFFVPLNARADTLQIGGQVIRLPEATTK